jgi:SAM-dependent methyltransferase
MFDRYAVEYDAALERGLSLSGEDKSFFARRRVEWLRDCLAPSIALPRQVMDFGCGTGANARWLFSLLGAQRVVGIDDSAKMVDVARQTHASTHAEFFSIDDCPARGQFDLIFCNGVFHHIAPSQRAGTLAYVFNSLHVGGLFAFWENSPWNPGTRWVMSRIPFDRDAILLSSPEARRLLRASGFEILRTDFLFIFPKLLSWLRPVEPYCARLPFGAQYQVLCRKPSP